MNGSMSPWAPWAPVSSGIPQGSVLGPILFICYINDMPNRVTSDIQLFADDTKIYRRITTGDDNEALQDDLANLEAWTQLWQLRFNAEKCKVMYIGQHNSRHEYTMKRDNTDIVLSRTTEEKDLGVFMDPSLSFSTQVERVVSKANRMLGLIRRSYTYLDGPSLTAIYQLDTTIAGVRERGMDTHTETRPTDARASAEASNKTSPLPQEQDVRRTPPSTQAAESLL